MLGNFVKQLCRLSWGWPSAGSPRRVIRMTCRPEPSGHLGMPHPGLRAAIHGPLRGLGAERSEHSLWLGMRTC
jgi:hypothetical protein